jgi:plastocyanin
MARLRAAVAPALLACVLEACADGNRLTDPSLARQAGAESERTVQMMDACDPATFNAFFGPGTCLRSGGVTLARFLALLGEHQRIGAWHFAPGVVNARVGQDLVAVNQGGEVHTFTEVEAFGGGFVPELNALSGNPVPAPECLALDPDDFVPPGGTYSDEVEEPGTERYQCCIHPWMRATVSARP